MRDCKWATSLPAEVPRTYSVYDYSRYEAYFKITQKHLPLINREAFFRALKQTPEKHQALALKYAVCMAGAQAEGAVYQLQQQFYVAARFHLEQAELGSGGSSFWTVEAAQTLVLVARFEFWHFVSPRAMVTMSRLFALLSVLCHQETPGVEKERSLNEEELNQCRVLSLINLSMRFREPWIVGNNNLKVSHKENQLGWWVEWEKLMGRYWAASSSVKCLRRHRPRTSQDQSTYEPITSGL